MGRKRSVDRLYLHEDGQDLVHGIRAATLLSDKLPMHHVHLHLESVAGAAAWQCVRVVGVVPTRSRWGEGMKWFWIFDGVRASLSIVRESIVAVISAGRRAYFLISSRSVADPSVSMIG